MSKWFIRNVKKQFSEVIWAMDNFYKDKEAKKRIEKLLKAGEKCFNLPYECESKDANDYLKEANIDIITDDIVKKYTYEGNTGLVKLKLNR